MKNRKGFTLVELMVVVLIVSILAAVAIPLMRGRIDSAKWSEGKSAAGTIASAIRAYAAEKGTAAVAAPVLTTDLGFGANDLDGTYFLQACYTVSGVAVNAAGQVAFTISVDASKGRTGYPTTPATTNTLTQAAGAASVWAW
ncbi:MAG: prepilin-type N-terminal cleavage/methylation domain-containing protein [Sedimentisphaerales bacterium]